MSIHCGKLCSSILYQHFGNVVKTVANCLFSRGPQHMGFIKVNCDLPLQKIREAFNVLIEYGLVDYESQGRGTTRFTLLPDKILAILRYPRFLFFVKKCCGDEGEVMLEEVLKEGCETASGIIIKTYRRMLERQPGQPPSLEYLLSKFELVAKNQFLMRSKHTPEKGHTYEDPDFSVPLLDMNGLKKLLEGGTADAGDNGILWRANIDRLDQDLRDTVIVGAVTRMIDENAGELMRQMLFLMYERTASWSETSNPIPFIEIKEKIKTVDRPYLFQYLDQYLKMIEEDSRQFLRKVGDSGGGQYSVNMKEALAQLAWATIENIVMEKLGTKAARIFRLVKMNKYIEVEQIQQMAMIAAKEAKHLTFILLHENYLQLQEVRKAGVSAAPSKCFFLFHIDLNQVVRMQLEHCYQALYNTMQRRERESADNKRLLDRHLRMQTLLNTLKEKGATEEQLQEITETMTPSEKVQIQKVHGIIKTLGAAEMLIEETMFLFTMYLHYH